jgi:TRAP-type uncharacterized transport system substrate-binding protein
MTIFPRSLLGLALGVGLMAGGSAAAQTNLEWASGSPGGSWFSIVTGLSNIIMEKNPDISIRVVPGGGRDNPPPPPPHDDRRRHQPDGHGH